ncbi:MAG: DUF2079 domain-containing protein [Chloroflexota bacterium]|nr:DUF2079 domain-containing protein [Dehalococcoidia bacterium]MDW8254390.1 DUF2079 domain-containing protein [Chloroflexota bacterium]
MLRRVPPIAAPLLSLAAALAFLAVFTTLSIQRHNALRSNAYDLAIFDQAIYNTAVGRPYAVSIKIDDLANPILLGDHFSPAIALLAPLTWVWNDVRAILVAQSLLLAAGALPVYRVARWLTQSPLLPPALVVGYFLTPTLQHTVLYDFHEVALAVPALAFAAEALVRRRRRALVLWLSGALLCKEEIAFVAAGFGATLLLSGLLSFRHPRAARQDIALGAAIVTAAIAWAILTIGLLIPWFEGSGAYTYVSRYETLGRSPDEIVRTALTRPDLVLALVLQPVKLEFVLSFFAPFAFLPVLAPTLLVLTLPTFGYLLLSSYAAQYSLGRQYGVVIIPLVAVAAAVGTARLAQQRERRPIVTSAIALGVGAAAVATYLEFGPGPGGGWFDPERYVVAPRVAVAAQLFARIPPEASVSAQENLAPHLSRREHLYLFPALHGAEFIILDNEGGTFPVDRATWDREVAELLRNPLYRLVANEEGFALFQRQEQLPGIVTDVRFGQVLRLAAVDLQPGSLGLVWEVMARWEPGWRVDGYRQEVRLRRPDGTVAAERIRPPRAGSGFFETGRGIIGERIWERFDLPASLAPGVYTLEVTVRGEPDGPALPRAGALPELRIP